MAGAAVDRLAKALSDSERRTLLARIEKSLSVDDRSRERIIHATLRAERRAELVRADLNALSGWDRVRFWLRRLVGRGSEEELFVAFRLERLQARFTHKDQRFVDLEGRRVLPGLPEVVVPVAQAVQAVRPLFRFAWGSTEALRGIVDAMLAARIPDAKVRLDHFAPDEDLDSRFADEESRTALKQLVLERIASYVDAIPDAAFQDVERGLTPLYAYKELVLLDFDSFFGDYRSSLSEALAGGSFGGAAVSRVMAGLERLHLAIHNVRKAGDHPDLAPEAIGYFRAVSGGVKPPADELYVRDDPAIREQQAALRTLATAVRAFHEQLNLADLIRTLQDDPYYRFVAYVPRLRLREFYYANLKVSVLEELDRRFVDVRLRVIDRLSEELFPSGLSQFSYFTNEIPQWISRHGYGSLNVYRSLRMIRSFFDLHYANGLHPFLRILARILPKRSLESDADLSLLIAALEDTMEKLRLFDESFAPDKDEGRAFLRFRTAPERDPNQVAALRTLIDTKSLDARMIIEEFDRTIRVARRLVTAISSVPHDHLNERYRQIVSTAAEDRPFDAALERTMRILERVLRLHNHIAAIEAL